MLTSTVYRKPTHTDRYLHFKFHHPNHVKREIVRCLYQRARRVTNMSENLKEEEKHLHKVLQSDGYDNATIRAGSIELPSKDHINTEQEKGLILTIPYIAGLSESIQRVCRDFDIKTAFKSGKTLRSHLTKVGLSYNLKYWLLKRENIFPIIINRTLFHTYGEFGSINFFQKFLFLSFLSMGPLAMSISSALSVSMHQLQNSQLLCS